MKRVTVISMAAIIVIGVLIIGTFIGDKKTTDQVRYIGFKVYDPIYVAKDKGFFARNKVDVKIVDLVAAGPNGIQAVSGGSAEACLSSFMATINARATGLPVTAVSDIQSSIGDQPLEEFFVRSDSGIKSVSDLKGKKIAINLVKSSFHYTWLMAMKAAGLSESDVEFVILPFDQQEIALKKGQVDAIGLMQPYILHAKENGKLNLFFTASDVFGNKQFSTHVLNSVWAKDHEKAATAFVTSIVQAEEWIEKNQQEAKAIISRYTGVDVKYIEDYHYQKNGMVNLDDAQYWLDYMKSRGDIQADWMNVSDFATNKFNEVVR